MSEPKQITYITPVGLNLVEPIVSLVAFLDALNPKGTNEVQASVIENGYSSSIIVLTACLLEATMNRVRYVDDNLRKSGKSVSQTRDTKPYEFFRERFLKGRRTVPYHHLVEVFILRDVIAHSHLWEAIIDDSKGSLKLLSAKLGRGYGDAKFNKLVSTGKPPRTKFLKLNVFPTRISCWDALKILKTSVRILNMVEQEGDRQNAYYVSATGHHVPFKGRFPGFKEIVDGLRWDRWKA